MNWDVLNEGNPIFTSTLGSRGLRDPQIVRSPEGDRFFMVATDLKSTETGYDTRTGSKSIMVFESADLVNWEPQRMVKVAPDDAGSRGHRRAATIRKPVIIWCTGVLQPDGIISSGKESIVPGRETLRIFQNRSCIWRKKDMI